MCLLVEYLHTTCLCMHGVATAAAADLDVIDKLLPIDRRVETIVKRGVSCPGEPVLVPVPHYLRV